MQFASELYEQVLLKNEGIMVTVKRQPKIHWESLHIFQVTVAVLCRSLTTQWWYLSWIAWLYFIYASITQHCFDSAQNNEHIELGSYVSQLAIANLWGIGEESFYSKIS